MTNSPIPRQQMVQPLYYIFWGILLITLDIATTEYSNATNSGTRFDFIPDIIGAFMIMRAVKSLRTWHV